MNNQVNFFTEVVNGGNEVFVATSDIYYSLMCEANIQNLLLASILQVVCI